MATARASIICYYDVISPYACMGIKLFNRFRKSWADVDVVFTPVLLGGIMNQVKNQPLFEFPSKFSHMTADLDRTSAVTGIPFAFPKEFPVNTVLPMRVLTAVQLHETAERYEQCIEKLFDEYFVHGRNISKAEIIKNAITPILGENTAEADKYLQLANQPEIKQIFKTNTDEAIARGAFGTPTFIVKTGPNAKEMLFFGSDRFETISAILGLPYPGLLSLKKSNL